MHLWNRLKMCCSNLSSPRLWKGNVLNIMEGRRYDVTNNERWMLNTVIGNKGNCNNNNKITFWNSKLEMELLLSLEG